MRVDGYIGHSCAWVRLDLQARFYPVGMVIKRCFSGVLSRALFPCSVLSGTTLVSYRARRNPRRFIFQAVKVGRPTGAAFRPFRNVTPNAFYIPCVYWFVFVFIFVRCLLLVYRCSFFGLLFSGCSGCVPLVGVWLTLKPIFCISKFLNHFFLKDPFFAH